MTGGKRNNTQKGNKMQQQLNQNISDSGTSMELNVKLMQPTGMEIVCTGTPPSTIVSVSKVGIGTEAEGVGVQVEDKIDYLNGVCTKKMTATTVSRLLKKDRIFCTLSRRTDASAGEGNVTSVQFSSEFYAFMENAGDAILKVRREGSLNGAVCVHYYTEDGSAKAGVRYIDQSGVVPFTNGQAEAEIRIPLIDDEIWQDVEDFRVVLWGAEHPHVFHVSTLVDPTGLLPADVSLVVSNSGLEMADPVTEKPISIPLQRGKPLKCFWAWDQIGHIGAVEQQEIEGIVEGESVVHMTCEGAGVFKFRCADFTHASTIAKSLYSLSRSIYGQYDESNRIEMHKLKRQGSAYGRKSSAVLMVQNSDGSMNIATEKGGGKKRSTSINDVAHKRNSVAVLGGFSECCVQVINDDQPGIIKFDEDAISVREKDGKVKLVVRRMGASCRVTCQYSTKDGTAVGSKDYMPTEGTLVFEKNETQKVIEIDIIASIKYEKSEYFLVLLSDCTDGASFDNGTDGGTDRCLCKVTITDDKGASLTSLQRTKESLVAMLYDKDKLQVAASTWSEQFGDAWICHGEEDDESNSLPISSSAYLVHYLALPWKLLFCIIAPVDIAGGWACFYMALSMTGCVTIVIGDLAAAFGCVLGLENSITAITFVALGTSLPDTFASKSAATNDPTADAAIGNVTGSNAVNVFLGLGLPWVVGAFYWHAKGPTDDWKQTYPDIAAVYPGGGFAVPAGTLAFSVSVFVVLATICLLTLYWRRKKYGAELGGPEGPKMITACFFIGLWLMYVGLSIAKTKGFI
jgi:Ca2+/Na+ antiporter